MLKAILKATIAGDAAGYPFEGMKQGHIKSHFKNSEIFPDIAPALKNKMEQWKKAGLYSSISQFLIILLHFRRQNHIDRENFIRYMSRLPEIPERPLSFFRAPGGVETNFIERMQNKGAGKISDHSSSRIIPLALVPATIPGGKKNIMEETLSLINLFTKDSTTMAASVLLTFILRALCEKGANSFAQTVSESIGTAISYMEELQSTIFQHGVNPNYIIDESKFIQSMVQRGMEEETPENSEKFIVEMLNRKKGTSITRGTVDSPALILSMAIMLNLHYPGNDNIIEITAKLGGNSSPLTALTAMIAEAGFNSSPGEKFMDRIINKKNLIRFIEKEAFANPTKTNLAKFSEIETSLTQKEMEEYKSRNKRNKKAKITSRTNKKSGERTSKHTVESWTKEDRAKWKKEKKKLTFDIEERDYDDFKNY